MPFPSITFATVPESYFLINGMERNGLAEIILGKIELKWNKGKSGNFRHQVNSDIHLQTVEIKMRRLLMSCLIRIFTVCLVNLFLHSINQNMKLTGSLSEFT